MQERAAKFFVQLCTWEFLVQERVDMSFAFILFTPHFIENPRGQAISEMSVRHVHECTIPPPAPALPNGRHLSAVSVTGKVWNHYSTGFSLKFKWTHLRCKYSQLNTWHRESPAEGGDESCLSSIPGRETRLVFTSIACTRLLNSGPAHLPLTTLCIYHGVTLSNSEPCS